MIKWYLEASHDNAVQQGQNKRWHFTAYEKTFLGEDLKRTNLPLLDYL